MKAKKAKPIRILLVDKFTATGSSSEYCPEVFDATVATIDPEDGKPRNWSRPYFDSRFLGDTGGFSVRAFVSSIREQGILSFVMARTVHSSNADEYIETARALAALVKREAKLRESMGSPHGAAEVLIRQILTLNVSAVFIRPEGSRETWLSAGEWKRYTVGDFANQLRRTYPAA